MAGKEHLTQLQLRKRLLVLQSDLNRLMLVAECQSVFTGAASVEHLFGTLRKARRLVWAAAPLLGFLVSRRREKSSRAWGSVIPAAGLLRGLLSLLRNRAP